MIENMAESFNQHVIRRLDALEKRMDAIDKVPVCSNPTPPAAPHYRMLSVGEVIRDGDEMLDKETQGWELTKYFISQLTLYPNTVRRRIVPDEKEIVAVDPDGTVEPGDYVLATKYHDGEACDHWGIGYFTHKDSQGRFYVKDANGINIRGNGFRRCRKISKELGKALWDDRKTHEDNGAKLWDIVDAWEPAPGQAEAQGGGDDDDVSGSDRNEDPTIQAIVKAIQNSGPFWRHMAESVIAKIKAGEVPGICTAESAQHKMDLQWDAAKAVEKERDSLRQQLADALEERSELSSGSHELRAVISDLRQRLEKAEKQYGNRTPTQWAYDKVCEANENKRKRIVELEAEVASLATLSQRDRIRELEKQLDKSGVNEERLHRENKSLREFHACFREETDKGMLYLQFSSNSDPYKLWLAARGEK